ncbi:MAG TPA: helix-turn-helix domain-containing protein [Candidatus Sumerlaeota bacterium]|nr:helix-turn-helix domain-containing protein [Candidatus Sumerlaeota bacterium]
MQRLQTQDTESIKVALPQEIVRFKESRYGHRLPGVLLVRAGKSCDEAVDLLSHSPRTIQYWVESFEQSGWAGLQDNDRPGRPIAIDERTRQPVVQDLRLSPREWGYEQNLWGGKLLLHHLARRDDTHLGVRQCQRLFHELGFCRWPPIDDAGRHVRRTKLSGLPRAAAAPSPAWSPTGVAPDMRNYLKRFVCLRLQRAITRPIHNLSSQKGTE